MSLVDEIMKIPPVTRFLCGSLLGVSLPMMMQIVSPYKLLFVRELVTQRYEIWRVFTSFFIGGSGINFIFDLAMTYRNSDDLESRHYAGRSADYAWQLILAAAGILALNIPLRTFVHTRALLIALTYVSSSLAPAGTQTSFFGLLTIPAKYLPYVFVAMDFLMGGPSAAAVSISGAVVGHLWWWGVWHTGSLRAWGSAPAWLRSLMGQRGGVAGAVNMGGVHVIPPRREAARTTGGTNWGPGRRLGD
ncbi:Der1-like family-domain-containing protein [Cerioporus squamosus]|nr:Der1-like family-domain-containing protein [Cerioporus squamosus]